VFYKTYEEQSNYKDRLPLIYDTLGYNLPDSQLTTGDIHTVHPVEHLPKFHPLEVEISTERSFVTEDGKAALHSLHLQKADEPKSRHSREWLFGRVSGAPE
jgi:hypothetical protein